MQNNIDNVLFNFGKAQVNSPPPPPPGALQRLYFVETALPECLILDIGQYIL